MRLNKFISESGLCSRREADRFISQGTVFINGRKALIGDQVQPGDRVRVNGHELEPRQEEDLVFIALNKPVGVTSTTEENVQNNIVQFVNHSKRIFPIGRLDKDSQGLIFLTNNGDLVNKILRAGNNHEKEYLVTVNKPLTDAVIQGMAGGVPMMGVTTRKCKIFRESPNVFRIVLVQGLNRQIRRMCEHFGYEVIKLERIRIMNISLKGLPTGDWRDLTGSEMSELYKMIDDSSSEVIKKSGFEQNSKEKFRGNTKEHFSKRNSSGAPKQTSGQTAKGKTGSPGRNNPDNRKRKPGGGTARKSGGHSKGRR
ncbi:MAG TPA: 23S rRNA pseudouridine(2604) synthase RluF [Bacteroidia bacterium]|nr:23S rRNA pseudouridine(2604) synthase RluF [Bacteroidia bacterium]